MQAHNINMATKEEIEEEINRKLGTELDWREMKKEDLLELNRMIDEHELLQNLFKHGAKDMGQRQLESMIDEWYPGKLARRIM